MFYEVTTCEVGLMYVDSFTNSIYACVHAAWDRAAVAARPYAWVETAIVVAALCLAITLVGAGLIVEEERHAAPPPPPEEDADLLAKWMGDPIPRETLDELERGRWRD